MLCGVPCPTGEPEDIAMSKVMLAAKEIGGPTLVEDTSLCYNALKVRRCSLTRCIEETLYSSLPRVDRCTTTLRVSSRL